MIGIIGTGWGARVQIPAFRAAGLPVVALAGQDAAKTARIAAELNVPFATGDWRRVIARSDVELVSIVTPPSMHAEMAQAALSAGKHVLCEKPTALNLDEAAAMAQAAVQQPWLLAMIDHELRFLPALVELRRLIAAGAIGIPRAAESRSISSSRRDATRPWSWWSDSAQGGGLLGAVGSHQVDTLRYLLQDEVIAANGQTSIAVPQRPGAGGVLKAVTADDGYAASLRFARGATATIVGSSVAASNEPFSFTVYGSDGTLRSAAGRLWRVHEDQWQELTLPSVSYPAGLNGEFPRATLHLGQAMAAYFGGDDAALDNAATFEDGLAVQATLDAVRASSAVIESA